MAAGEISCALPAQTFTREGKGRTRATFSASPLCVEFQKLLRKQKSDRVLHGVSSRELLNVVMALYDVCLPGIGVEDVRANVCARGSKTILLLRDQQEVLKEYQEKFSHPSSRVSSDKPCADLPSNKQDEEEEEEEESAGMFATVFSDSESSEEDEEEESESDQEESERFKSSVHDFLALVTKRRFQRTQSQPTSDSVGIECCIVAALTYQRSALKSKEKIIELTLLSTRRRYRSCGVGRYMLQMLKDTSVVGFYDAIVTHAESEAVKFFLACGFSDDILLNSKFSDLEEDWTNTTTMSYFPPFCTGPAVRADITDLELEMEQWKKKSLAAHQAQAIFMNRIFHEVRALRTQVASQSEEICRLTGDLEEAKEEKYQLQKTFLKYQLRNTQKILEDVSLGTEQLCLEDQLDDDSGPLSCGAGHQDLGGAVGKEDRQEFPGGAAEKQDSREFPGGAAGEAGPPGVPKKRRGSRTSASSIKDLAPRTGLKPDTVTAHLPVIPLH